ncbi:hypothetical protein RND71_004669 [Anisodus tanguticus]|uniref:Uncharacterized protein n=1 Tax=Anisodus tanguticus TaxID=243964 RepID=A0AAE1SQ05_9SOLA|nr:hypothetical protein RND71_004669 [Anisodus tanguticus]
MPTQKEQFLRTTSFPQQDNVAVQTLDMLNLPAAASSGDFFRMRTQADSSGNVGKKESYTLKLNGKVCDNKLNGISFNEIRKLHTKSKLLCCHFNSQGELLDAAGQNMKVHIWELGNYNVNTVEGHTHHVTDVRFRPDSTVFATSSLDRTVKIWDAAKPSNPIGDIVEHAEQVMSIDFHPTKVGLLSSCDSNDEIRLWDVNRGDCKLILKGGSRQVRFQPQLGDLLASSTENNINIFDVKTNSIQKKLQGHIKDVRSICWDMSGNYLASACEDIARIWPVSDGKCIYELFSSGNKFQSCTFRPGHSQVLVISSDEFLDV